MRGRGVDTMLRCRGRRGLLREVGNSRLFCWDVRDAVLRGGGVVLLTLVFRLFGVLVDV